MTLDDARAAVIPSLFKDVRPKLQPLYICHHTKGLMSPDPCKQGCSGQTAMFREDDLRKALDGK